MNFLWNYLKNYRKTLALVLVLAAINQIFSLLDPQIFRLLVDNYASKANQISPEEFLPGVSLLLLGFVGVALISRIAKNFQDYFINGITNRLGTKLYTDSIAHTLSLPYQVFENQQSGDLLNKLQKARSDAQALINGTVNILFVYVLGISFVLIYAFWVHWAIGLTYFLIIPTLGTLIFFLSKKIKNIQQSITLQQAELAGLTTETMRNMELVKSLGLEKQEITRLNKTSEKILQLDLKRIRLVRTLSFIQGTMINFLRACIMFLMIWLIFKGQVSLGEFFSLLFYSFFLFNPLGELSQVAEQYQAARASSGELKKLLQIKPEPILENSINIKQINSLEFKNVSYRYEENSKMAVKNINFKIKAGENLAFVGPSGSGKSTIIKLLVRLYAPQTGEMFINGDINAADVSLEAHRQKIGLVAQETQLFAGTIKENLLFVRPTASDEECWQVLKESALDNLLARSTLGLDTKIGEGGIKLSGGERQRLAIARALLRRPDLLIFDEATSSLDSLTEKQIIDTIKKITLNRPNMITVMVAHRLSTVAHADQIYVLQKGEIVESGKHDQLTKTSGLYAALWREQLAID